MQITEEDIAEYDATVEEFGLEFIRPGGVTFKGIFDERVNEAEERFGIELYNNYKVNGKVAQLWLKSTSTVTRGEILTCLDDSVRWQVADVRSDRYPNKICDVALLSVAPYTDGQSR